MESLLDMKEVCYMASVGSGTVALGMISAALGYGERERQGEREKFVSRCLAKIMCTVVRASPQLFVQRQAPDRCTVEPVGHACSVP